MLPASLLDEDRHRRLDALEALDLHEAAIYALRSAMVLDEDAEVRARAAARLGAAVGGGAGAVGEALHDALRDASPAVREAAAHTAGRLRAPGTEALLGELARLDPSFRVRRAALRALADVAGRAGEGALGVLGAALDDPFWRVRYAAVQVLARWPEAPIPAEGSPRRRAAVAYLERVRRGDQGALDALPEPPLVDADDLAGSDVADDDPAVTAARLATSPKDTARGEDLVAFLASPHDALRRIAALRLVERGRPEELLAALHWLDDPRVPYATLAVTKLLRRADTRPLLTPLFASGDTGPGALAWALDEASRLRDETLLPAARRAALHPDARVRRAALAALAGTADPDALHAALDDPDEACRAEAIRGLGAAAVTRRPDGLLVERARVEVAQRWASRTPDAPWIADTLHEALASRWTDVRAHAIAELARRGRIAPEALAAFACDPDPWIRAAALDASSAPPLLEADPDPGVRRAAMDTILRGRKRAPFTTPPEVASLAARSDDPWIRARSADLFAGEGDEILAPLLLLTRDTAPMVRASAADALDRLPDLACRCARLLEGTSGTPEPLRLAAHAQLLRDPGPRGFDLLVQDLASPSLSPDARDTLLAMTLVYPAALRARAPHPTFTPRARAPRVLRAPRPDREPPPRRPLGRTGLAVAPLGLSGAFDLPVPCFTTAREAGVDLFFWEPEYRSLTEFVRRAPDRRDLVVVAGSYEADARSIERDADRALARLGLDTLGVMLLFWVRSPARLTDEAFTALARLKQQGKIRALGFSTHLRDLAASAIAERPWDVIMCRLSAAHPGAERGLLPAAAARGVGVIAFSALLYGRMLARGVSAPDAYRYCLSQPGVSVCLSAPRRFDELSENLAVLRQPALAPDALARLRAHGVEVHAENRAFQALVREGR
jgi:diketogulonate reductase-like aldo/keto reductase/HEAT repeat protein